MSPEGDKPILPSLPPIKSSPMEDLIDAGDVDVKGGALAVIKKTMSKGSLGGQNKHAKINFIGAVLNLIKSYKDKKNVKGAIALYNALLHGKSSDKITNYIAANRKHVLILLPEMNTSVGNLKKDLAFLKYSLFDPYASPVFRDIFRDPF